MNLFASLPSATHTSSLGKNNFTIARAVSYDYFLQKNISHKNLSDNWRIISRLAAKPFGIFYLYPDLADSASKIKSQKSNLVSMETKMVSIEGNLVSKATKMDSSEGKLVSMETKMDSSEGILESFETKMASSEGKLDSFETKLVSMETKSEFLKLNL